CEAALRHLDPGFRRGTATYLPEGHMCRLDPGFIFPALVWMDPGSSRGVPMNVMGRSFPARAVQ
ncbi:MAG: hypothetical protein WBA75_07910, partial [Sphingopyxis granuli]